MGFKPMLTINIFQLMKYQKASQIQALIGFKPKAKYFAASETAKKKAYKILKERAYGISKEKPATFWLLRFKPMTSMTKHFLTYETPKQEALKI